LHNLFIICIPYDKAKITLFHGILIGTLYKVNVENLKNSNPLPSQKVNVGKKIPENPSSEWGLDWLLILTPSLKTINKHNSSLFLEKNEFESFINELDYLQYWLWLPKFLHTLSKGKIDFK